MKLFRYLTITTMLVVAAQTLSLTAKNISVPKMYMFGFAASFNDSIVHITEIQATDNVWIDQKSELMAGRENYSYQLRDYLADKLKMPHRTCIVFYNRDRQKLEKEYLKMKRLYTIGTKKLKKKDAANRKSLYELRIIPLSDFVFQTVDMSESTNE